MHNTGAFGIDWTKVFVIVLSVAVLLLQIWLCRKGKKLPIKLIPLVVFSVCAVVCGILSEYVRGVDNMMCHILMLRSIRLAVVCGIGWGLSSPKGRSILLKIMAIGAVLVFVLFVLFVYFGFYHESEVCRVSSPDGEYEIVLCQVGSTFLFSPAKARLKVLDGKGRTLAKIELQVNNDGGDVKKENIEGIRWYESYVEVDIRGWDDGTPTTYTLAW